MTLVRRPRSRASGVFALLAVSLTSLPAALLGWGGGSAGATGNGDLLGTPAPLRNVPREISTVAGGRLIVYRMPGIEGKQINATAMLFTPKGAAPQGGRPLLVWGHGTVGWAPECAPSVQL